MYFTDEPASVMSARVNTKRQNPRRREILEATLRVIGDSGVNSVTHRAVAREADVALASTTYYFDSKSNDPSAFLTAQYELMLEAGRAEYLRPLARRWTIAYMDGFNRVVESAGLPERATEIITNFV